VTGGAAEDGAGDDRMRLFVALELPGDAVSALVAWREDIVGAEPALRAVPPTSLHVTLCFLGWCSASEVDPIARACETLAGDAAPELRIAGPVWLPPRRPGVLAVRLSEAATVLADLQRQLADRLAQGGWYVLESRRFLPHVTVARVRKGGRVRGRALPALPGEPFTATRVTLYRSRLVPGGPLYQPLASVGLTERP
jgi:RNA 2',3'-cyclic 3'-phosphodiesterase